MPIQIIDNFNLGSEKPIDNRLVVGPDNFYTNRNDVENKYIGLRIWDINDNQSYVWDGTSWEVEFVSNSVGPGATNSIAKFTSSNTIEDSIISESNGQIQISGVLLADSFSGIGSQITQLDASSITQGVLSISRLQSDLDQIILSQGIGNSSVWTNLSNITVGNSNKIDISQSSDSDIHHITMTKNLTTSQDIYGVSSLKYQPSTGRLIATGSVSIGTDLEAPSSGLLVNGSVKMPGLNQVDTGSNLERYVLTTDSTTNEIKLNSGTVVPVGGIIMWDEETLPNGFAICDGCTYVTTIFPSGRRTPDLRNHFVIGSPDSLSLNTTGTAGASGATYNYYNIYFIMYVGDILSYTC